MKAKKHTTTTEEAPHYVSVSQYIRMQYEQELEKDPLAKPLSSYQVHARAKEGVIKFFEQGKNKFIDWNKYRNVVFKRNGQLPVPRKQK